MTDLGDCLPLERLTLRRFSRRDGPALCPLLSRRDPPPFAQEAAEEECLHLALTWEKDRCRWAACLGRGEGAFLGQLLLSPLEGWPPGFWELGYEFLPEYQGQGFAYESCRGLLEYGFRRLEVKGVAAFCEPENRRSLRLLEKLGMKNQGLRERMVCRADRQGNMQWRPALVYWLERQDFWKGRDK